MRQQLKLHWKMTPMMLLWMILSAWQVIRHRYAEQGKKLHLLIKHNELARFYN